MNKETIAVDLDDVLADHAAAFIEFSNEHYGTALTKDDYTEQWNEIWGIDDWDEILRRANEFHTPEATTSYVILQDARSSLESLAEAYSLAIVTARPKALIKTTHDWLERHLSGVFSEVHFVPIWEPDNEVTKADICRQIGAQYLIDDVVRHCNLAAQGGVNALLFGGFQWHQGEEIDKNVVQVRDWRQVLEYFDGRS